MGRGNAEPSAKNSEGDHWKTARSCPQPDEQEGHEGTREIHDSSSLRPTALLSDEVIPRQWLTSQCRMGIWERRKLEFSASIHNLQLNTEFTHDYHLFFPWIYQKMSSQSFIILKKQGIHTTAKTPETKSNKSDSLEHETELVCW